MQVLKLPQAYLSLAVLLWELPIITAGESAQDFLTKNITHILDMLLKEYDNSQHPNHRAGRPTIIRANMLIRSMGPISEYDMDFSLDCYFRQHWNDPRLIFRGPVENLSLNIKMLEKIWRPDTYFHNGKRSYVHAITLPNKLLRLSKDGDILYSMRLTIKAKCPMSLRNFPMDTQSCPLVLGSFAYTSSQVLYEWQGDAAVSYAHGMGLALSQFDLLSSPYRNFSVRRKHGEFSVLQVNFNLVRFAGYFLIQIYVPCILIVVLSFVGFFINREATSDRVALGVTSILTLCTIGLDSRNSLPKVHYATALDWFLFMCFGYVMATVLEFASVHYFTKVGSGDRREGEECVHKEGPFEEPSEYSPFEYTTAEGIYQINENFRWGTAREIYATPVDQRNTSKGTQTEKKRGCFSQFLKCVTADERFRRERQASAQSASGNNIQNSVSRIDKICRVLFPLSFFCLNCFYWRVYSYSFETYYEGKNRPQTNYRSLM